MHFKHDGDGDVENSSAERKTQIRGTRSRASQKHHARCVRSAHRWAKTTFALAATREKVQIDRGPLRIPRGICGYPEISITAEFARGDRGLATIYESGHRGSGGSAE